MDFKEYLLAGSVMIALASPVIAVRAILKGSYKPHRTTRLIYVIVTFLFVGSLFAQGDRIGIFLAFVQLISTTILFLLSIKYGMGGTSKTDILVLISALITLFIWKSTNNATWALYMSILTDMIGTSPTLVKAFKLPFTEDPKFYGSDTIAGFLNILSLRSYQFYDLAFPGYIFLVNFLCVVLIYLGRRKSEANAY